MDAYAAQIPDKPGARYFLESTPHYFQILAGRVDVAANIRAGLGDIPILLLLRDPVARYESAYIHHMMKGRFPYAADISRMSNEIKMLELGHYGAILRHWQGQFSRIGLFFFDDLQADPAGLAAQVCAFLGIENDIPPRAIAYRANARADKARRHFPPAAPMPRLTPALRSELAAYYAPHIAEISALSGRDLSHWGQA